MSNTETEKVSFTEKVGYGLGDTASNLYWKLFENFQMIFYTDVFGIGAGAAATMFLVTKIWDAINDPMVGFISDRTRTAWGRFRPYLLWMSLPFAITGIMTFYTPDLSSGGKLVYAYITYTLVFMAYTAINIPYGALMGVISTNSLGTNDSFNLPLRPCVFRWTVRSVLHQPNGCIFWRRQRKSRSCSG